MDIVNFKTPTGGQSNVRGVLVQTLIALLDALLGKSPCEWLQLEPDLSSEKFDLLWQDTDGLHAVQVKTSINPFTQATVDGLTNVMATTVKADAHGADSRLVLVGFPAEDLVRVTELNGVAIVVRSLTVEDLTELAAPRLHEFLDCEGLGPVKAWFHKVIVGHLVTELAKASTKGTRVPRETFVADLKRWVTESPNYLANIEKPWGFEEILRVLRPYHQKLAEECQHVTLLGLDRQAGDVTDPTTPELAKIYIHLNTTETKPSSGKGPPRATKEMVEPDLERLAGRDNEPLPALEGILSKDRCVFLGGPGSGKSTLFRYLAFCLAKYHADGERHWLDDLPGESWKSRPPVPVWVELRRLAASFQSEPPPSGHSSRIWDFVAEGLKKKNLESALPALREALEQGHALILLDGLDEVPEGLRAFVRQSIESLATGGFRKSRIVVTCRVKSYVAHDLRLNTFHDFTLAEFTPAQSRQFVDLWYRECANKNRMTPEDADRCIPSLAEALRNPRLEEMARNPMHLTAMACLHTARAGEPLPEESAKLFDLLVDTLLFLWAKAKLKGTSEDKGGQDELGALLKEARCSERRLRETLERLAFQAHEVNAGQLAGDWKPADITAASLKLELARLDEKGQRLAWAENVIEAIRHRAGLLQSDDGRTFQFTYRFQEFLAGAYLANEDAWEDREAAEGKFAKRAAGLFDPSGYWRNVVTWAAGIKAHVHTGQKRDVRDLVDELCKVHTPPDPFGRRKLVFAVDIVREARLSALLGLRYGPETVGQLRRQLLGLLSGTATADDFPLKERAEVASQLGWVEDPRPGVGCQRAGQKDIPDLDWATVIEPGGFLMGCQEGEAKYDDEKPQFTCQLITRPYCVSRYPITVAQYRAFVAARGYEQEKYWSKTGWAWRQENYRTAPENYSSPFQTPNHPRVGVCWHEAMAFCEWLNAAFTPDELKLPGQTWRVRLPTEAEWERAARHTDGRVHPWGNAGQDLAQHCNMRDTGLRRTSAVGLFSNGLAECGAADLVGNVWEWCLTKWRGDYKDYEQRADQACEGKDPRVVRGGSWYDGASGARCAYRFRLVPDGRFNFLGFRVVASPFLCSEL